MMSRYPSFKGHVPPYMKGVETPSLVIISFLGNSQQLYYLILLNSFKNYLILKFRGVNLCCVKNIGPATSTNMFSVGKFMLCLVQQRGLGNQSEEGKRLRVQDKIREDRCDADFESKLKHHRGRVSCAQATPPSTRKSLQKILLQFRFSVQHEDRFGSSYSIQGRKWIQVCCL